MADIAETKYGLDGKVTFEQADGGIKVVDLANLGGAAGAGVTNISFTRDADTVKIESDTGNDATVPAATNSLAGVMSAAQATKLAAQADTPVLSVAGKTGVVTLTGADVGLGSVNNTSDSNKPISTATQLALNQKQNTLTAPGDVPGLTTALAGKQNTITTYTEVSGLTSALNAKQNTLTGVADVPNLQAALDAKQGRLAAGTNKLLAAPAALGGTPVQVTIGANLAFDGTTLSSTASGGGSSTYAGLTDAASVNLPTVNTPLNTALGNKAEATQALVVTTGMTLDRTPVTGGPTGHYNRQLGCAGGTLTVSGTGAVALDTVVILNTHASTNLVVTFPGSVVLTALPGKFVEAVYDGSVWKDVSIQSGTTYTDAQALAASVLSGALGTDTTKAPTHSAVTNAIAAIPGSTPLTPYIIQTTDAAMVITRALHAGKVNNPRMMFYSGAVEINLVLNTTEAWQAGDTLHIMQLGDTRVAVTGTPIAATFGMGGIDTTKNSILALVYTSSNTWVSLTPRMYTVGPANGTAYPWYHGGAASQMVFRFGNMQSQDLYIGRAQVYNQATASGSGNTNQTVVEFLAGNTLGGAATGGYGALSQARHRAEITNTGGTTTSMVQIGVVPDYRTSAFFTNEPVAGKKAFVDCSNSNGLDFGSTSGNSYVGHWARFDTLGNWITSRAVGNTNEFRSTSTGSIVIPDNTTYVTLAGAGSPNIGVDLPVNPFVGQIVTISLETAYSGLSLAASGRTIIGNVMALTAGSFASWRFTSRNTWQRIG